MSSKVVFFGSGPLAAKTLESLLDSFEITAVITKPQPEHGHKTTPPVIELAQAKELTVFTPKNKQELAELFEQNEIDNQVGIVVDYGIIIPKIVIEHFAFGIINSHFSLLPRWRGADPITFPLLEGDVKTGVSLMLINEAMDEGELIAVRSVDIANDEDASSLTDKLINLSNQMLPEATTAYLEGHIDPWPQDSSIEPTYSRKLSKEDGKIDWNKEAEVIERETRAFSIWPKSYGQLAGVDVVITEAEVIDIAGEAGQAFRHDKQLAIYCGQQALLVHKLKVAGKPEMSGSDFLNGYGSSI